MWSAKTELNNFFQITVDSSQFTENFTIANYSHQECLVWLNFFSFKKIPYSISKGAGRKMIYGKMPMLTFILAAGYLFTVYLLLALAKRTGKKSAPENLPETHPVAQEGDVGLTSHVTEVVNSQ